MDLETHAQTLLKIKLQTELLSRFVHNQKGGKINYQPLPPTRGRWEQQVATLQSLNSVERELTKANKASSFTFLCGEDQAHWM